MPQSTAKLLCMGWVSRHSTPQLAQLALPSQGSCMILLGLCIFSSVSWWFGKPEPSRSFPCKPCTEELHVAALHPQTLPCRGEAQVYPSLLLGDSATAET